MKKIKKILAAALVSASLFSSVGAFNAFAASQQTGYINGIACTATLAYVYAPGGAANGVRASTAFGPIATSIYAKATVYYKVNGVKYKNSASNTATQGGVSATAYNNDVGNVYGGKGYHVIRYSTFSPWYANTSIGETWN